MVCQITVKPDVYNGKTTYKVAWLDNGDAIPKQGMSGASTEELVSVKSRFGGALRAAAAAAKAKAPMVASKSTAGPTRNRVPGEVSAEELARKIVDSTTTPPARVKSTAAPTLEEANAAPPPVDEPPVDPVTVPEGSDEAKALDDFIPF